MQYLFGNVCCVSDDKIDSSAVSRKYLIFQRLL